MNSNQNSESEVKGAASYGPKKMKGFFQVGFHELKRILASGGNHHALMAYLVVCGGVDGNKTPRLSTHGALSVSNRIGVGYRVAQRALQWLQTHSFISSVKYEQSEVTNHKRRLNKWLVHDSVPDIALSQNFLNSNRKNSTPSLLRLSSEVSCTEYCSRPEALIDTLLLYIRLMQEQDFGEWSGVNPEYWHSLLQPAEENSKIQIDGTDYHLVSYLLGDEAKIDAQFISDLFPCIDSEEGVLRKFHNALENLQRYGLVYQCINIWSHNPIDFPYAEPLGTLYIKNTWARDFDKQALDTIHKVVWETGAIPREEMFNKDGSFVFVNSEEYRVLLRSKQLQKVCLVTQLRVRHWPSNSENCNGRQREYERTASYIRDVHQLTPQLS